MRTLSPLVLVLLAGCFSPLDTPDAAYDAGEDAALPAPRVLDWRVVDHGGRPWPAELAPRQPIVEIDLTRPVGPEGVYLFDSSAQALEDLEDDLGRAPLRVANDRARVPVDVFHVGATLRIVPERLDADRSYVLALASWMHALDDETATLEAPFVAPLHVAAGEAGAAPRDAWPPDGAAGIPSRLSFAAVRFDDHIEHADGVRLEGPEGVVRTEVARTACRVIGWTEGECIVLHWDGVLEPNRAYRIVVDETVVDRGGAMVGPWSSTFETGAEAIGDVVLLETPCALDERSVGPFCLVVDDRSVTLRARANGPVRAFLDVGTRYMSAVAPRGELRMGARDLEPDADHDVRLVLEGPAGATFVERFEVHTEPPLPAITITEVRADARGPEPRQEYVELLNSGAVPVRLEGWSLSDRIDREGDVIEGAPILPPNARALVVGASFDPRHPDDPPVPDGVPLVRLDGTIASGGLSNSGEPIFLRDDELRRISAVPAMPAPGPGVCWVREDDGRGDDPALFFAAPCTPGRDTPTP